jgi:hypothetical protein
LAAAVHASGGTWIAPAAPGFDARQLGGTTVVPRGDGQTLRREVAAAREAQPDAIGLISWNEFSENSHLEPSEQYGRQYLDVVSSITRAERVPAAAAIGDSGVDSSGPGGRHVGYQVPLLVAMALGGIACVAVVTRRTRRGHASL